MSKKKRLFDVIQIGHREDFASRFFDIFIVIVIFANIVTMFMETFSQLDSVYLLLHSIETITMCIFVVEYLLRLWTSDLLYPGKSRGKAMLMFVCSAEGIIDLLTILPFFFLSGFIVFRMLRVIRIFHLFRINGKSDAFQVIWTVLKNKAKQILSSLIIILILLFASSLCMYSAEHPAQPEVFSNAFSGVWWSVNTMLTVGYGDIFPITAIGRVMAIIIAFLGVGSVAIPTGIISAGFVEEYTKAANETLPMRDIEEIGEIRLTKDHHLCGLSIRKIHSDYDLKILVLLREDMTVVATDELVTRPGDILVVQTDQFKKCKC